MKILFTIGCFIIGVFFSFLIDKIAECRQLGYFNKIFYKNNINKIKELSVVFNIELVPDRNETQLEAYWGRYYTVQKAGLLGNVPALETLSAFLLNLSGVSILYVIVEIIYFIWYGSFCNCKCSSTTPLHSFSVVVLLTSSILLILSKYCRDYIEGKIYLSIISAYKFLMCQNDKRSN